MYARWFLLLAVLGCRTKIGSGSESVDTETLSATDDSAGAVDSGAGGPGPGAPVLLGSWPNCAGTLTIAADRFDWSDAFVSCEISGDATVEDTTLTLAPGGFADCGSIPWWLNLSEGDPVRFGFTRTDARLTLVPTGPISGGRIAQFATDLRRESWALTADDEEIEGDADYRSQFNLCHSADGSFFDGSYYALDDECEFLSCGGRITALTRSDSGEHWSTSCGGHCPCSGVVTVQTREEEALSGHYNGSNCARQLSGSFTGVPID